MDKIGMFEIIAILGALAWIPQLYKLYKEYFIKPKLTIISDKVLELGYNTSGPIVNIRLALVSSRKRALVNRIDLELIHEHNESHKFSWNWFEETLYEVNIPNGGLLPTKKNQNAIAIKVEESDLIEKKIGFHQNTYKSEYKELAQLATEDILRFHDSGKENKSIESEKSYNDLLELFKKSFNWKSGKYLVKLKVHTEENQSPFEHEISFKLSSLDRKSLEMNLPLCKQQIHRDFINQDDEAVENWFWVYPVKTEE